jgi:hypothetical protein
VSKLSSSFCFIAGSPAGGLSAGFSGVWATAGIASKPTTSKVIQFNRERMI